MRNNTDDYLKIVSLSSVKLYRDTHEIGELE
jgi:hypothetical protein